MLPDWVSLLLTILAVIAGVVSITQLIEYISTSKSVFLAPALIVTIILVILSIFTARISSGSIENEKNPTDKTDYTEQPIITYTPAPVIDQDEDTPYPNIEMDKISKYDITSSGYLIGPIYGDHYYDTNILDGKLDTAWFDDNENGFGYNEWVQINFDQTYLVNGVMIYSGLHSDYEYLHRNNRIKDIEIVFSDGSSIEKTLDDTPPQVYNKIDFNQSIATESIRFVIKSVYPADYPYADCWDDTGISEIILY